MDYCYACRRHLNGAFSCPGCGTIAQRPATPGGVEAAAGTDTGADTAQLPVATEETGTGELPLVSVDGADLPPPADQDRPVGRMAELSALADLSDGRAVLRAARHRRKRTAFYGMGAIAVIGALAMFSVTALSGGESGGGAPTPTRTGTSPTPTTDSPSPDGAGGPSVTPSNSPTASASPSASDSPSPTATHHTTAPGTTAPPKPPVTATATATRPPSTPPTQTASPSATPSPTKTCQQVLWWCS